MTFKFSASLRPLALSLWMQVGRVSLWRGPRVLLGVPGERLEVRRLPDGFGLAAGSWELIVSCTPARQTVRLAG